MARPVPVDSRRRRATRRSRSSSPSSTRPARWRSSTGARAPRSTGARLRADLRRRRLDRRLLRARRAAPRRRRRACAACASSATSASTRRCTPASSRARGEIVVTMDSDLQNPPEDLPKLIEAVESGYDVASGRRVARRDSWGRTLPSRLINGMLRRFTRVDISDFGCAFNALPARGGRAGARRDRQAEVHEGARPLDRRERGRGRRRPRRARRLVALLAAAARARPPCSVLAGFWPQPIQWIGLALGAVCTLGAFALGCYGVVYWIDQLELPGPAVRRRRGPVRARRPGLHPRARRRVPRPHPARRLRPPALHDRPRTVERSACSSPAGRGSSPRPSSATCCAATPYEVVSLDALTYAGNLENLADVMAHARLSFVHGDIRDARARRASSSPRST